MTRWPASCRLLSAAAARGRTRRAFRPARPARPSPATELSTTRRVGCSPGYRPLVIGSFTLNPPHPTAPPPPPHPRAAPPAHPPRGPPRRPPHPRAPARPPPREGAIRGGPPGTPPVPRQCRRRGATMTEAQPHNDFASSPAPAEGILVTMFITVRKVA